uniref:Protein kinase domain-containing protein n=1 Tax=Ananas comosus var. bracteatus TaxID=296719 RepID=A0A6V7QQB6_ANACO
MEPKTTKLLVLSSLTFLLILILIILSRFIVSKTLFFVAAVIFSLLLIVIAWILLDYTVLDPERRKKSTMRNSSLEGEDLRLEYSFLRKVAGLPTKFSYKTLEAATDDFRALIGRGSSGAVYKGILDDGTAVAVKRIDGAEHGVKEFQSEVAAIGSVQHVNLVRLLGYCLGPRGCGGPRYLVYEYAHNGSLDSWIFSHSRHDGFRSGGGSGGPRCLPWAVRYQVAIDVAKALAYLHHDCRSRVLHLDVKPENILLDECFHALVSDFGLSKLMGRDQSRIVTTVRGTKGYLAPEWLLGAGITEKSDIYSYGMVLLEIVGGRRNVRLIDEGGNASERRWSYFPKIVAEKVREGRIMEAVDERLTATGCEGGVDKQVETLVYVALWCIQEKANVRPSMPRVVDMLEGRVCVAPPPEPEMIVVDLLSIDQDDSEDKSSERKVTSSSEDRPPSSLSYSFAFSALSGR